MSLAGDVVLIYGPNGIGKTSIAQSIEWAITGQIDRLSDKRFRSSSTSPDPVTNVFAQEDVVRVRCLLSDGNSVTRIKRGNTTKRWIGQTERTNDREIIDYVVGTTAPSREGRLRIEQLRELFRGSHLLSQHNIHRFLEFDSKTRFDILTNMIGAEAFVRFRRKVSTVINQLKKSSQGLTEQRKVLEGVLNQRKEALPCPSI